MATAIFSGIILFLVSVIYGYVCLGMKVARNKKKVGLESIDRSVGGFLVTHGMVRDKTSGRLKPDDEYSELFYRSLTE